MFMLRRLFIILTILFFTNNSFAAFPPVNWIENDSSPSVYPTKIRMPNGSLNNTATGLQVSFTGALAPNDANFIVGTENTELSNEIVAGTSPGGELGGTWASPTIDAIHSGSAHHASFLSTDIDTSAELLAIVTDETGSASGTPLLVFNQSPTIVTPIFTTDITTPKVKNSGNITIDAINAAAASTVYVLNSDGTYKANLDVEGDLVISSISVVTGGTVQFGSDGYDGILKLYSEQGVTDYIASLYAHTAMTANSSFYLPAAVPGATSFLNMTTGGVMGYIAPNAGTDITADLEEEVTEGSLADSTIVSADIKNGEIVSADLSGTAGITLAQTAMTAGRSLTISTNDVAVDPEAYTDTKCIYFENPVATDDFKSIWRPKIAATLTSIWAESDQTVTFMLQRDDGSPTDVDSVDLAPAAGTAEDTSLDGDATFAAGDRLDLAVTSVANTPTWCSICWTFTYDD